MTSLGRCLGAATACAILLASSPMRPNPVSAAPSGTWFAGAGAERITPPPFDASADLAAFPEAVCPRAFYDGVRHFGLQEPYRDVAGSGFFDYTRDPYCDANHNGRWDGLYTSGGVDHLLEWVHDDIWARALAISDGHSTVVLLAVTSQGLGYEDFQAVRAQVADAVHDPNLRVFGSSTHNESSPDPIGIYGAPDNGTGSAGVHSGIDDYYISSLVSKSAAAAVTAVRALQPARLRAGEFTPGGVRARLSTTFLTTDATGRPESTDNIARVLQATNLAGSNIGTLLAWAAHNQQVGHADEHSQVQNPAHATDPSAPAMVRVNRAVSDDWPGVFASALEASIGGQAMFVPGDNGSIEDPHAQPLPDPDNECPAPAFTDGKERAEGCFELPSHTGLQMAREVRNALASLDDVEPHPITSEIRAFVVPLQNQLFIAAFAAGLFAHRTAAGTTACIDANSVPRACFTTEVGRVDLGPAAELMFNPGEAYPALIEGHPMGIEQVSCPTRPEPPVPAWHGHAAHRIQVGLADDMIGYEIPAPGWYASPAVYADPTCPGPPPNPADPNSLTRDVDTHGRSHKLESESVGPDGGNLVAVNLSALADEGGAPPAVQPGRFLMPDGTTTRRGADGPVGMWVMPPGSTTLTPGKGTIVALAGIAAFGANPVTSTGWFVDFDGRRQEHADINTRGMEAVSGFTRFAPYYMDPYPVMSPANVGAAVASPAAPPPAQLPATTAARGTMTILLVMVACGLACVPRRRRRQAATAGGGGWSG